MKIALEWFLNPDEAKRIYYDYSKQSRSELMDGIIEDTIPRFNIDIKADEKKWQELYDFLEELDIVKLGHDQYGEIWK